MKSKNLHHHLNHKFIFHLREMELVQNMSFKFSQRQIINTIVLKQQSLYLELSFSIIAIILIIIKK